MDLKIVHRRIILEERTKEHIYFIIYTFKFHLMTIPLEDITNWNISEVTRQTF